MDGLAIRELSVTGVGAGNFGIFTSQSNQVSLNQSEFNNVLGTVVGFSNATNLSGTGNTATNFTVFSQVLGVNSGSFQFVSPALASP